MVNIRLKKIIMEVVDNQLRDNDPPCTKHSYEQLLKAGYTVTEAKERIGAIVLEEMYDVLKNNAPFDEDKFAAAMTDMVQQSIDLEDGHHLPNEWRVIGKLIAKGYTCIQSRNYPEMVKAWLKAWELTKANVAQAEFKIGIMEMNEATDYEYSFDGWLQDMEMELSNAREHEKRMQFCQEVLDVFTWEHDNHGGFKMAIGESLYALGKQEEGLKWFEGWLEEEPHNVDAVNGLALCLDSVDEADKAFYLLEKELENVSCTFENYILFYRAIDLAESLGEMEKKSDYEKRYQQFKKNAAEHGDQDGSIFSQFIPPSSVPVVKSEKIYPNDKCPCGSGKKYKKCCGRG